MLVLVVGCNTLDSNTGQTKPIVQQKAPRPLPSAAPLQSVSEKDVLFAQTALKQLGYLSISQCYARLRKERKY